MKSTNQAALQPPIYSPNKMNKMFDIWALRKIEGVRRQWLGLFWGNRFGGLSASLVVWRVLLDINMPWIYPQPPGKCQWQKNALKGSGGKMPSRMRGWNRTREMPSKSWSCIYQFNKDSCVKDLPLTYQVLWNWVGSIHSYTKHNKLAVMNLLQSRTLALFMSKAKEGHSKKI